MPTDILVAKTEMKIDMLYTFWVTDRIKAIKFVTFSNVAPENEFRLIKISGDLWSALEVEIGRQLPQYDPNRIVTFDGILVERDSLLPDGCAILIPANTDKN